MSERTIATAERFALASACVLASCALESGHGFATIRSAELTASFEAGRARDLGEGAFLTNLAYRVTLARASLSIQEATLEALEGAGGSVAFDPARPPPGYTLCHSGHCHAEDGRLVPYEDVERELAGGTTAEYRPVVEIPIEHPFDLLRGEAIRLDVIEPSRELPEVALSRARLSVTRFDTRGEITGGAGDVGFGGRVVPFGVALSINGELQKTLAVSIDRDSEPDVDVHIRARVGGAIFDDIDFARLESAGEVTITSTSSEGWEKLRENVLKTELEVEL